tara:strand:+ start:265 stop:510 length:246 start_codon:yes stop_codon:yes gene_type:complete
MSELINKLEGRSLALCALGKSNDSELMEEAADTIEQLTKERDSLDQQLMEMRQVIELIYHGGNVSSEVLGVLLDKHSGEEK